jgi:hypothetical protein
VIKLSNLIIHNVQKVAVKENENLYSCAATNNEIQNWKIKEAKTPFYFFNGILFVLCKNLIEKTDGNKLAIEVVDPIILSKFGNMDREGIYLVIFKVENLPELLLNSFLKSKELNNLVEMKSSHLSKNSLKFIAFASLNNLLKEVFEDCHYLQTDAIGVLFKNYFEELIKKNSNYFPNTLHGVQEVKEKTIIHNINSWYVLINFFKEQLNYQVTEVQVPNLLKKIEYRNWTGSFFERENPFWEELYANSRHHYPSRKNKVKTYNFWKELTEHKFEK